MLASASLSLVLAALAAAAPAPAASFSMAQWVEDLISSPETALSVEDATAAYLAAIQSGEPLGITARSNPLVQKRQACSSSRVPAGDAAACVNYLAGLGTRDCVATGLTWMCRAGQAAIVGVGYPSASSHCVDVARGAGRIMDVCTSSDGWTGGQHTAWGNGNLRVIIQPN